MFLLGARDWWVLFGILTDVFWVFFVFFYVVFSIAVFISGVRYRKAKKGECQVR